MVKIETLERLAELLNVSITTLLGVGTEYIPSAISYFERIRQLEQVTTNMNVLAAPFPSLLASERLLQILPDLLLESYPDLSAGGRTSDEVTKLMDILRERRMAYAQRKPTMLTLISAPEIDRILQDGLVGYNGLSSRVVENRRAIARAEVEHFCDLIERQPVGVQIGVVKENLPHSGFHIFYQQDRKSLALSPFRLVPNVRMGVAMITSAPEALMLHEMMVVEMWGRALKGSEGADFLRRRMDGPPAHRTMKRSPKRQRRAYR